MAEADPHSLFAAEQSSATVQGHVLRSEMLDAFSNLESRLCELASKVGVDIKINAPMSQKIKAIQDSGFKGIKKKEAASDLLSMVLQLAEVRAGLVHSKIETAVVQGQPAWLFRLVPHASKTAKIMSQSDFDEMIREIKSLANRVKQLSAADAGPIILQTD
jgi:hypothetical protein